MFTLTTSVTKIDARVTAPLRSRLSNELAFTALGQLPAMLRPALALGCGNPFPGRRAQRAPRSRCLGRSGIRAACATCTAAELRTDLTNLVVNLLLFEFISDQRHS
jgi:hypothetical protein